MVHLEFETKLGHVLFLCTRVIDSSGGRLVFNFETDSFASVILGMSEMLLPVFLVY